MVGITERKQAKCFIFVVVPRKFEIIRKKKKN